MEAGQKYGIKHAGYYAMKALRVEKFYAFWGQDLDTTTTPLECGRSWRVKFDVSPPALRWVTSIFADIFIPEMLVT